MNIKGTEYCPWCECENDFDVDTNTWIMTCETCGRPIVLCDKCHTMNSDYVCHKNCKWENKSNTMMKKWEKEQIGRIVYWNDPDNDNDSDYCRVVDFNDDIYVIRHLFYGDNRDIEVNDSEIEVLDDEKVIDMYCKFFDSDKYIEGKIRI